MSVIHDSGGKVFVASALEQDDGQAGGLLSNLLSREPALVVQTAEELTALTKYSGLNL
jgi:hypothetical protein